MEADFTCPLCDSSQTSGYRIGATATFRVTCGGTCGEYDYSPSLFESMAHRSHWANDRRCLSEGLRSGVIKQREFRTVMDIQKALREFDQHAPKVEGVRVFRGPNSPTAEVPYEVVRIEDSGGNVLWVGDPNNELEGWLVRVREMTDDDLLVLWRSGKLRIKY